MTDNLDNIGKYAIQNSDGFEDMKEKSYDKMTDYGKKGAVVGGANAAADYLSKDHHSYFSYYYKKGEEYRSCVKMEYNYLASGSETPQEWFTKHDFEDHGKGLYYRKENRFGTYTIGTSRKEGDRYIITLEKHLPT